MNKPEILHTTRRTDGTYWIIYKLDGQIREAEGSGTLREALQAIEANAKLEKQLNPRQKEVQ